jgi:hypothetical protein
MTELALIFCVRHDCCQGKVRLGEIVYLDVFDMGFIWDTKKVLAAAINFTVEFAD